MNSGPLTTLERFTAAAEVWHCQEVLQKLDVLVWDAEAESLRTGYISGRAEKMLGYPADRWLAELGFFPTIVHPSDQVLARRLIDDVRRDGKDRQTELRLVHSDGRELWFQFQLYPADCQRPLRVLRGLFVNISEQRAASAQLNNFLESAPDAIVVVDVEGRIVNVNHLTEVMFGSNRTELLGNRVEMLVPQRYRHSHVRHREHYSAHPQTRPMGMGRALTGLKKDGSEFPIEISLVNELLSNCLKHAFPGDRPGEVWIQVEPLADDQLWLTAADDGVGLPEGLELLQLEILGLQPVRTLAHQLDGAVETLRSPRTEFRITFPDSRPETRQPHHEPDQDPGCRG